MEACFCFRVKLLFYSIIRVKKKSYISYIHNCNFHNYDFFKMYTFSQLQLDLAFATFSQLLYPTIATISYYFNLKFENISYNCNFISHFCDFLTIIFFISYFYDFLPIATIFHICDYFSQLQLYISQLCLFLTIIFKT